MGRSIFQIYAGADEQYYSHLRAGNGAVILASEGYCREAGCRNGIASVMENSVRQRKGSVTNAVARQATLLYETLIDNESDKASLLKKAEHVYIEIRREFGMRGTSVDNAIV